MEKAQLNKSVDCDYFGNMEEKWFWGTISRLLYGPKKGGAKKYLWNFGKNILEKQKAEGVKRKLVGFEMIDKGIPRHNYEIKDASGKKIGYVTSGTQSPSLQKAIGMGYVTVQNAAIDTEIFIAVRDKLVKTKIVKIPFD